VTSPFRWPASARVDRELTKERLYKEGAVSAPVRRRFIDEVQQVRWAYTLSEESIRLPGNDEVPEVQVFEVELKGDDVSDTVLAAIDKAVPSPIIFELHRVRAGRTEIQTVAARKQRGQKAAKVGDYLRDEWTVELPDRDPLPPAIALHGLYAQLMFTLLPIPARRGEVLSSALDRVAAYRKLQREIGSLGKRVQLEGQFNRKVELRAELRRRQSELEALLNPIDPTPQKAAWTS
jgi:predicted nuclease with TOPRIM domain